MSEFARGYHNQQQQPYDDGDNEYQQQRGGDEDRISTSFRRQRSSRRIAGLKRNSNVGGSSGSNEMEEEAARATAEAAAAAASPPHQQEEEMMVAGDDEVLEQYRIMAQVEAQIRVKDNTGFDMAEYEERRRLADASLSGASNDNNTREGQYYKGMRTPKPIVPPPREVSAFQTSTPSNTPEEPPLLLLSSLSLLSTKLMSMSTTTLDGANNNINGYSPKIIPEVCPGVVVRGYGGGGGGGGSSVSSGGLGEHDIVEHLVRCLGCRAILKVHRLASLVSCPDCSTISPACSMKRR